VDRRIYDASVERLSRDEVGALQMQRLTHLLQKVSRENEFYRRRWNAVGASPDRVTTLERFATEFPTVEKRDFVEDQQASPRQSNLF